MKLKKFLLRGLATFLMAVSLAFLPKFLPLPAVLPTFAQSLPYLPSPQTTVIRKMGQESAATLQPSPIPSSVYSLSPMFDSIATYSTTLIDSGDPADIYYPDPSSLESDGLRFPVALFLQGLNVDKAYYSQYAKTLASYGFIVVVPNHLTSIRGRAELFAQVGQVPEALAHMKMADDRPPLAGIVDSKKLVLLGHSHGGMMGLDAIRGACDVPFCVGDYSIPEELVAAVFFGTFLWEDGEYLSIDNADVPIALIAGSRDSLITPKETQVTYEQIYYPPKAYIMVNGANHYGIADLDNPPGSPPELSQPTLDPSVAVETIARWSALFLRAHALGDPSAFDYIYRGGGSGDPNVKVIAQT